MILRVVIIFLVFLLAGVLFIHNLTSINADIGRHIGLGKIIWQLKEVPKTNLLSFTAPNFPFINHHWLSEVIFYGVYSLGSDLISGLRMVIVFKVIILLAVYLILFLAVRKNNIFAVALAFIISILVFSARTEPRPEIFSYLIFAAYLAVIYNTRGLSRSDLKNPQGRTLGTLNWLWILPVLQLLWVNLHIYFILGPVIFTLFLVDRGINTNGLKFWNWSLFRISSFEFRILLLIIVANLVNPNFINGALYPLKVFSNYGYSIAENSSLFFLAKYFGQWAPQDKLFLASLFILAGSFILSFWFRGRTSNTKRSDLVLARTFDLLLIALTVALSFKMQRNIPLYALSLWPVLAKNLDLSGQTPFVLRKRGLTTILHICTIFLLAGFIYLVVSDRFYNWLDSSKNFGLEISSATQDGIDFVKENKINGPVFNNFDIGSYLAWQLFPAPSCSADRHSEKGRAWCGTSPDQKVFIDGRPEAYPVEFFEKVYKPMQKDKKVWQEMSEKYAINYIFFAHTDMTEWADEFLTRINGDKEWSLVFLNDAIVIFLKNSEANKRIINEHKINESNIDNKVSRILARLDKKDDNAFINFGNALYRFRWLKSSAIVFETLIANQPDNPYGYQGAGYAYVTMNDSVTQQIAGQNLKKAIDLGFKTFNNYFTLGIINANLGNFIEAEKSIKEALKINPENQNAKSVLQTIRDRLY